MSDVTTCQGAFPSPTRRKRLPCDERLASRRVSCVPVMNHPAGGSGAVPPGPSGGDNVVLDSAQAEQRRALARTFVAMQGAAAQGTLVLVRAWFRPRKENTTQVASLFSSLAALTRAALTPRPRVLR